MEMELEKKLLLLLPIYYYDGMNNQNLINLTDINWNNFFELANMNNLLQLSIKLFNDRIEKCNKYCILNNIQKVHMKRYENELTKVKFLLNKENINFILLKGLAITKLTYNDNLSRYFSDLDLIINEIDFEKADNILVSNGYRRELNLRKILIEDFLDTKTHEIKYYKNGFTVELKRNSSAFNHIKQNIFFENSMTILIKDEEIRTLNIDITFLHLLLNTYRNNSYSFSFRDYVDIYLFYKKYYKLIDWTYLKEIINLYNWNKNVNIMLQNLNIIFPQTNFSMIENILDGKYYSSFARQYTCIEDVLDLMDCNSQINSRNYYYNLFCNSYSLGNVNYEHPIKLNKRSECSNFLISDEKYIETPIVNKKYHVGLKYFLEYSNDYLYLYLKLNPSILIKDFLIKIMFYDKVEKGEDIMKKVIIEFKDTKISKAFWECNDKYLNDIVYSIMADSTILVTLPKIYLNILNQPNKLCFLIELYNNFGNNYMDQFNLNCDYYFENPIVISF